MAVDVYLRSGSGNDVYLRRQRSPSIDVYLQAGSGNDVYLRRQRRPRDAQEEVGGPPFPTQYSGFRTWYGGSMRELCLVAVADAPTGMGGVVKVRKAGTDYAVYLVETTDPDASSVRVETTTGTKSVRLKT